MSTSLPFAACSVSLKLYFSTLVVFTVLVWHFHVMSCALQYYNHEIKIDPCNGTDSENCIKGHTSCSTLEFSFSEKDSYTKYILTSGVHSLNSFDAMFKGLTTLAFIGNNSTIQCNDSGFAFVNVADILISGITFSNCSTKRKSTSRDFRVKHAEVVSYFQVGLYFYECVNVTMDYVEVTDSPSATGVVMYDTRGSNKVTNSIFKNNQVKQPVDNSTSAHEGGGGFYVEFTYCNLTQTTCNDSDPEKTITKAVYSFKSCKFTGNVANDSVTSTYIIPHHNDHRAFGRGGGLSIFVKGNSSANTFNINDCLFSDNSALWGAGLFVEFHDTAFSNIVNISSSNFTDNVCPYTADSGTAGGGMRIGHYIYGESETPGYGNWINLEKCLFVNNRALNGGGLSVSATPQAKITLTKQLSWITIMNTSFTLNIGRLGSAVHADRFQLISIGQILNITIEGCRFFNNSVKFLPSNYTGAYQIGVGTIFVHNVPMHFLQSVNFANNTGSGLAIVVGEANFCDCLANFIANTGNYGGGIALLGEAYIKVNNRTAMTFINNSATVHGGGIYNKYISRENLDTYAQCFIRHENPFQKPDNWGARFTFSGNMALRNQRKSSIYTTSILPCSWAGGSGVNKSKSAIFCWNGWSYEDQRGNKTQCMDEINTDVGQIDEKYQAIKAYPGHPFNLQLNITDDLGKEKYDIETVFIASIRRNSSHNKTSFFWAWDDGTVLKENGNVTLVLDTVGDRAWQISVRVELQPCPPGFLYDKLDFSCTCNTTINYGGVIDCDNKNFTALLRNGYWIGEVSDNNNSVYLASLCPVGFCYISDYSPFFTLNKTSEGINEQICGKSNRNGTLCGSCKNGFGPAINLRTFTCVACNDTVSASVLQYVATVYIPTIVLFLLIMAFKIRLTGAAANAFILYSQVISSTFNLDAGGQISLNLFQHNRIGILEAYQFIYGVFNLEYFENFLSPVCVGEDISTLGIISTDYGVAIAPLVMILVIVIAMKLAGMVRNCCYIKKHQEGTRIVNQAMVLTSEATRYVNKALLSAFAAYLLLSYTKFSLTSSYLLQTEPLIDENGRVSNQPERVYYAGHFAANDPYYISHYLVPSCIILVLFVVIPPILLLDYPLRVFEKCLIHFDCLWRYYPAGKIHVFLDTFQGSFKHNLRFFAGLYFLFRLTINVNFIVSRTLLQQYIVQQIACTIMVILVAIFWPYSKNNLFNYVDILIFSNLAIINALTLYLYGYTLNNPMRKPPVSAFAIQYVLVYLPLIYMLLYVLWKLSKLKPCVQCWNEFFSAQFRALCHCWKRYTPLTSRVRGNDLSVTHTEVSGGIEESLMTGDAVIFQRAEMANTYQPANIDVMQMISEDQPLQGVDNTAFHTSNNDVGIQSTQPLSHQTNYNYRSTDKIRSRHSGSSSASRSTGGSSQCKLDTIERGQTWPMQ